MGVIIGIIIFMLGGITGVTLMCLVQINRDNSKDKQIKELEDEIAMMGWLDIKEKEELQ